ncbi:MAG: MBL fold metallo-hydrolase [Puniceicoccaceae bacterium]
MEVVVLGSGTSTGVPVVAQADGLCDLQDARNWRTRSSVHVSAAGYHLQIDAAPEFRLQCLENRIPAVHAFILTHGHADHILGMDDLRRFCNLNGNVALPVYGPPEALQRVQQVFPYAITSAPVEYGYPAFTLIEATPSWELGPFLIQSTLLPHGSIQTLGTIIEEVSTGARFTYFTDCGSVPPEAVELARETDLLILDGLRPKPHRSHLSIPQAIEVSRQIGARRTYLTHLTAFVDHHSTENELPPEVRLAYDGLRLSV